MEPPVQPTPAPQPVAAAPAPVPSNTKEKASFLYRAAAFMLDQLIIALVAFIFGFVWGLLGGAPSVAGLLGWLIYIVYNVLFIGFSSATPGKKLFNLQVVTTSGEKISWGKTFLREVLGKIVSSIPFSLGYFWMLWDKDKQTWHDKIASTYVVQNQTVAGGKKAFAYILVFLLPGLVILSLIASLIILAINPKAQLEKAKQQQQTQQQNYIP